MPVLTSLGMIACSLGHIESRHQNYCLPRTQSCFGKHHVFEQIFLDPSNIRPQNLQKSCMHGTYTSLIQNLRHCMQQCIL